MKRQYRAALALIPIAYFWSVARSYKEWHFIDGVNLVFHEAGHTIFALGGELVSVAAGSALQVAIPLLVALYFFRRRQGVSGAVCLMWAGQSLLNVSVYAADADAMALPLLGGEAVTHDWNYLLGRFGLLDSVEAVSSSIYAAGILALVLGTALALYFVWFKNASLSSSSFTES